MVSVCRFEVAATSSTGTIGSATASSMSASARDGCVGMVHLQESAKLRDSTSSPCVTAEVDGAKAFLTTIGRPS
jgi:hypothetical protein